MMGFEVNRVQARVTVMSYRLFVATLLVMPLLSLWGCTSQIQQVAPLPVRQAHLGLAHFLSPDGRVIPVRTFLPQHGGMQAVVIALHGFNDYSRAFSSVGPYFAAQGIGLIAYDQRGFGLSEKTGIWAGASEYGEDLDSIIRVVHERYPEIPVFLLGESMGAAVVISALEHNPDVRVEGVILSAPAVWSRDTMPWYQSLILDLAAVTLPEVRLTGSGLRVQASDNLEMLRGLGRDPWVIKATRIDAIRGLADLMDAAQEGIGRIKKPTLILYGGKDEIIPKVPVMRMWKRLSGRPEVRAAYYPEGFHLLLRDLEASLPLGDVMGWIKDPKAPLPSGCELGSFEPLKETSAFPVNGGCLSGRADVKHSAETPR